MTPPPWLQFFKFKYLGKSSKATNYLGHSPKAFKVNKIATEHYTQENENSGHHENIIRENSDQQKKDTSHSSTAPRLASAQKYPVASSAHMHRNCGRRPPAFCWPRLGASLDTVVSSCHQHRHFQNYKEPEHRKRRTAFENH